MDAAHKILVGAVGVVLIILAVVGFFAFRAHDAWKNLELQNAVKDERIKGITEAKIKPAENTVTTLTQANTGISSKEAKDIAELKERLKTVPTREEMPAIIQQAVPGLQAVAAKDEQGKPVLAVADTPENRDAINKATVDYQVCKIGLFGCQAREENYKAIVAQKDLIIQGKTEQISIRDDQIKKLKEYGRGGNTLTRVLKIGVPLGCSGLAGWAAHRAGSNPKATGIAAFGGGAVCAISIH